MERKREAFNNIKVLEEINLKTILTCHLCSKTVPKRNRLTMTFHMILFDVQLERDRYRISAVLLEITLLPYHELGLGGSHFPNY